MVLLRRVIGDALRARRQGQRRTLREVSTAANVSLGYLSEIERGQKEASSELLASICDALGAQLSELLRDVSRKVESAERMQGLLVAVPGQPVDPEHRVVPHPVTEPAAASEPRRTSGEPARPALDPRRDGAERGEPTVHQVTSDGGVTVSVRHDSPLKATLRTTRRVTNAGGRDRDVIYAA